MVIPLSLVFAVSGSAILAFLRDRSGSIEFTELVIGSLYATPVMLIKDSEFADRFWFRSARSGDLVEFALTADDLAAFTEALAQAVEDLEN